MDLTQESVLSLLISEGGRVKKSDLVSRFKSSIDCANPAQKERNRELFKTFVNNVAFVKEIDGVRYVLVRKTFQHMLEGGVRNVDKTDSEEIPSTGEQQRPPVQNESTGRCDDSALERSAATEPHQQEASDESSGTPQESLSPLQLALQRSRLSDIRIKRALNFEIQCLDADGSVNETTSHQRKHSPLGMSPTTVEFSKLRAEPHGQLESPTGDAFRNFPQVKRASRTTRASEEPKETKVSSLVPLEQSEHDWLVKCAAGQWTHVYGLLLGDHQLAEKRDFMSGFTAMHWASKCGNSKMLVNIIDLARKGGVDLDINAKTHGGYTPLHIAALHDQEFILAKLVGEYGADPSIRDNCGKKAYHYLHKGISSKVREMLGEPKARETQDTALPEKEDLDLFPDLSKGLHSISRLFQPHMTGHRKKHKQRPGLFSMSDDAGEGRDDTGGGGVRPRILSDVFL